MSGSIVNISLPTIADDLGVGISDIEWIVVAYLLTAGSLLLTFGRLGDIVGYKPDRVRRAGPAVILGATGLDALAFSACEVGRAAPFRAREHRGSVRRPPRPTPGRYPDLRARGRARPRS